MKIGQNWPFAFWPKSLNFEDRFVTFSFVNNVKNSIFWSILK